MTNNKELEKLSSLAQKKLKEGLSKEKALRIFMLAGILDKDGNYTKHYQELASVVEG